MPPDPNDHNDDGARDEPPFDKGAGYNPPPSYEFDYPDPPPPPPPPPPDSSEQD